jgi:hypothetical protein
MNTLAALPTDSFVSAAFAELLSDVTEPADRLPDSEAAATRMRSASGGGS